MARRQTTEAALAALDDLPDDEEAAVEALRDVLAKGVSTVAAKAARLAAARRLAPLGEDLARAFERFMIEPADSDKGCRAKAAIVRALREIEHHDVTLILRGLRHRQAEPVWGGTVDTACDLRGVCALALVDSDFDGAIDEISGLLADPEPPVRLAGARALGAMEDPVAVAPLRLKTLLGDAEPEVIGECLAALLSLDPAGACEFIARYLPDADPEHQANAALALGESRAEPAFAVLRDWYEQCVVREQRRAGLTAIALLRREEAFAYLMGELEHGSTTTAREVIDALSIYAPHETLRAQALAAARAGGHGDLEGVIEGSI